MARLLFGIKQEKRFKVSNPAGSMAQTRGLTGEPAEPSMGVLLRLASWSWGGEGEKSRAVRARYR